MGRSRALVAGAAGRQPRGTNVSAGLFLWLEVIDLEAQRRRKSRAALISVASNTTLVVFKLVVGLLIGSVSVISEAVHSGVDLIASLIALFAVRTASKPADEGHPFGHGKVENISGTIEALLIFGAAAYIIFEAVKKLLHPTAVESLGWGVTVMGISAVANFFVSRMLFKVGRETQSVALEADGWHLRTDVYTSVGVMAGLAFMWAAQLVFPTHNWEWVDPVVAMGIALLIIRAAYRLTIECGPRSPRRQPARGGAVDQGIHRRVGASRPRLSPHAHPQGGPRAFRRVPYAGRRRDVGRRVACDHRGHIAGHPRALPGVRA